AAQVALAEVLRDRLGALELGAVGAGELGLEGTVQMREDVGAEPLELLAVGVVRSLGRRAAVVLAELDHQLERRHVHRLGDSLSQLGLDALDQAPRIAVLVGKSAAKWVRAHEAAAIRRSPSARGSGSMPKSA